MLLAVFPAASAGPCLAYACLPAVRAAVPPLTSYDAPGAAMLCTVVFSVCRLLVRTYAHEYSTGHCTSVRMHAQCSNKYLVEVGSAAAEVRLNPEDGRVRPVRLPDGIGQAHGVHLVGLLQVPFMIPWY